MLEGGRLNGHMTVDWISKCLSATLTLNRHNLPDWSSLLVRHSDRRPNVQASIHVILGPLRAAEPIA